MSQDVNQSASTSSISTKLIAGAILGLSVGLIGLFQGLQSGDKAPFLGWLWGCSFWLSIAIGMLMLIMIFRVFNSRWSPVVRRQQEHALSAFPWLALCFVPLLLVAWLGKDHSGILWSWVNPESNTVEVSSVISVADDVLHQKKAGYLNLNFFTIRLIGYFAIFCGISHWLRKVSFSQDKDGDPNWTHLGTKVSAIGIPAAALALTFGAFDLFMSLEYQWFSTMYGVWFFASGMRAALAVTILVCLYLVYTGSLKGLFKQAHKYDLACLSLTFTIFWAYVSFSQYFLIYSANIPEETFWYVQRERGSWWWIGQLIIFGHFFLPFLLLLRIDTKCNLDIMIPMGVWAWLMHYLDMHFNIMPVLYPAGISFGFFDILSVGFIGVVLWILFNNAYSSHPPYPQRDPRIAETMGVYVEPEGGETAVSN